MVSKSDVPQRRPAAIWFASPVAAVLVSLLAACSADPETPNSGSCKLSCSQPRVGSSDFIIEPLLPNLALTIPCDADFAGKNSTILPSNGPVQVRFQVYEKVGSFGTLPTTAAAGGDAAGGAAGGAVALQAPLVERIPRGGIGFEPWLYGGVAVDKTAEEFKIDDKTVTPFKFAGVVTPSSEWCSDSCGVMTYEVWPTCKQGDDITVQASVAVHGAKSPAPYEFTLAN